MGALLVAAGLARFVTPAFRPFVFGAALTFALGTLLRLMLAVKEQSLIVPALVWASLPGYTVELSWQLNSFNLGWALITLLATGVPLLTTERPFPTVDGSAWSAAALAIVAPLILSGDLVASAVLLALLLGVAAAAALRARQPVEPLDVNVAAAPGLVALEGSQPPSTRPSASDDLDRHHVTTVRRLLLDQLSILGLITFGSAALAARTGTPNWIALLTAVAGALLLARVYPVHTVRFGAPESQSWRVLLSFLGTFILFRVMSFSTIEERGILDDGLLVLGLLTIVTSTLDAHGALDVRDWSARTIPADVGIAVVAIAVGTPLSVPVLVVITFGRMLGGAALALAGARGPQPNRLRQTWRDDTNAVASALAFGTLAGFPPLPGFIARAMLVQAMLASGAWLAAAVVVACIALHVSSGIGVVRSSPDDRSVGGVSADPSSHRAENVAVPSALPVLFVAVPLVVFALLPSGAPNVASWMSATQPNVQALSVDALRLSVPGVLLSGLGLLGGYLLAGSRRRDLTPAAGSRRSRLLAPLQTDPMEGPRRSALEGLVEVFGRLEEDRYLPAAIFLGVIVVLAFVR